MPLSAIIPAFNEEKTVANVVRSVIDSRSFELVCVVDDGSRDATASLAEMAGAMVLKMGANSGKGRAMLQALRVLPPHDIAFFDADLIGLRPDHPQRLKQLYDCGFDMVCGLRDRGVVGNCVQVFLTPIVTGDRLVRRHILDQVPLDCWSGYSIETAINDTCLRSGGRVAAMFMDGVKIVGKIPKTDLLRGLFNYAGMYGEMCKAKKGLSNTDGQSCTL